MCSRWTSWSGLSNVETNHPTCLVNQSLHNLCAPVTVLTRPLYFLSLSLSISLSLFLFKFPRSTRVSRALTSTWELYNFGKLTLRARNSYRSWEDKPWSSYFKIISYVFIFKLKDKFAKLSTNFNPLNF